VTTPFVPTMGVEEEYFLVDPLSRTPRPAGARVVRRAASELGDLVSGEFNQCQLEVKTPPCADAAQLRSELVRLRSGAGVAAAAEQLRLCASGTPVMVDSAAVVGDHPRYRAGLDQYRAMLDDFAVCSLHIHVYLPEPEIAVSVSNHLRPWLPLLVALSANSPFHQGEDTGYADWRAVIRSRFPCLGPPPFADSLTHHTELATAIAESGAMLDAETPFWDIRPNLRVSTLEIRTMDVTADVDDTVGLAALVRALVLTATAQALAGDPAPRPSSELLRARYWRAARDGWSGHGVDAATGRVCPTAAQAARLVDHVRPAAEASGDLTAVNALMDRLAVRGTGADQQRASVARRGCLSDVVDDLLATTARR
jgi:carboxylate-amine ligase